MEEPYSFTGISNKQLEEVKHHMQSWRVLHAGLGTAKTDSCYESLANQVVAMVEAMKSPEENLSEVDLDSLTVSQLKALAEKHRVRLPSECRRRTDIVEHLLKKARSRDRARASADPNDIYGAYHI